MKDLLKSKINYQPIAKMRQRENILNFMDPAAWYMTFFKAGVQVPGATTPVKGFDALYTTLLTTFATRNTLYLDIRNENSYALNYYKDNEGQTGDSDYGQHIQVSWDGTTFAPANYYKDYWPILTLNPPVNTTEGYNELHLKFRKLYNPEPLIYADFAVDLANEKLINISSSMKFKPEVNPVPAALWSDDFAFKVPNIPAASGNTAPAFPIKLMNIRQKNPEIALPNTVIAKAHFLDNVFGPANYTPDIASGSTTQWTSGLGKKFIDGRNEMGLAGIFETGMGISNNDVTFFASLIDEYRPGLTLGRSQVKESKPDLGGKSQTDSLTAEMKRSWFKDRNFALQKQELSGSTFYIMDQKTLNPPTNISGQINLVISRSEYDSIAIPSNLDTSIHTPLLSFENFNMNADNNDVPYRKAALKVNGASSSGTKTTAGLGVDLLTFNYGMLNSEAAGNVVDLEEAENGILTVDEFIKALKVVEGIYETNDPELIDTCTRIRRHSYGPYNDSEYDEYGTMFFSNVKNNVFDSSLPLSKNRAGFVERRLRSSDFNGEHSKYYKKLTAHANENDVEDNPSPYLFHNNENIDLGQILYGFESIFFQHHEPIQDLFPPNMGSYSPAYENFQLRIVNDIAGWVANIATPSAELFYRNKEDETLHDPPLANTLQAYYDYSAPNVDLNGNADAIGIFRAYQVLSENLANVELKLSDVFTLYYYGASELREGISLLPSPSQNLYFVADRWKIFSLFFGLLEPDGSGGYNWVPDGPNWLNVKAPYDDVNNQIGRNYSDRLFRFSTLWYNTSIGHDIFGGYFFHFIWLSYSLYFSTEFDNNDIVHFQETGNFNGTGYSEKAFVVQKLSECFEDKFLPYVKAQII